jgi:hypothetical protein
MVVDPPMRGIPQPRYLKPIVRLNGILQDAPFDWKLPLCYLDLPAILNGIGNDTAVAPATTAAALPAVRVGGVAYVLGAPAAWQSVVIDGTTYRTPLYT